MAHGLSLERPSLSSLLSLPALWPPDLPEYFRHCGWMVPIVNSKLLLVDGDVYCSPFFPHLFVLFYECPCVLTSCNGNIVASLVRVKHLPRIMKRLQDSILWIQRSEDIGENLCNLYLTVKCPILWIWMMMLNVVVE